MAVANWPGSLPSKVRKDFQIQRGVNVLRTPVDLGAPKERRRGNMPEILKVGFYMTPAQINTLENFVQNTLNGTARFNFTHPLTGSSVEVRIVPGSDGTLYTASYYSAIEYTVDMTWEVMP